MAVGAGLLLADDAPAADTELVKLVAAAEPVGVLQDALLLGGHEQLVTAHRARVRLQGALRDPLLLVVACKISGINCN